MISKTEGQKQNIREFKKEALKNLRDAGLSFCQAFCVIGCPMHQDNKSWLYNFRDGRIKEALDHLLKFNPFPSSVSRVCPKFCEKETNQFCGAACLENSENFQGSINSVEKYLGDWARKNLYKRYRESVFHKEKMAIIGAGPAGLACGYQLWHMGFPVTIFEKMEKPGGILYFGISGERLPNEILLDEISLHLGDVEIKTGVEINAQNFEQFASYDTVVIATGYGSSRKLGIPGETLSGVLGSLEFLSALNLQTGLDIKEKEVLIIGGGETAIEAALTAINFGGRAKIIYRKGPENLGVSNQTIASFKARGGEIEFYLIPREIKKNDRSRFEIKFERFGQERPETPDFILKEADFIVLAIGQTPQFESLPLQIREKIQNKDFEPLESAGIFIAGDLYYGQKNVCHAINSGNETAGKIYDFIKNKGKLP